MNISEKTLFIRFKSRCLMLLLVGTLASGLCSRAIGQTPEEKPTAKSKPLDDGNPDGKVVFVDKRRKTVWINIGLKDGAKRGLVFQVVTPNRKGEEGETKFKGRIEVVKILEAHLSEAKILEQPEATPIKTGDTLQSSLFDRHALRFFMGHWMDLNADGENDKQLVRKLILRNGGTIDGELRDDGGLVGELSDETDYLVIGTPPEDHAIAPKAKNALEALRKQAIEKKVKIIDVAELLPFGSYRPVDPKQSDKDTVEAATNTSSDQTTKTDESDERVKQVKFDPAWVSGLKWRGIGPATMGGRVVDLAVVESDPTTFYVATASGGLFKTTNFGTTFTPVFEKQSTVSIGDVCVSPSDANVVWVGTGEHNARNSVSWGDGVYKSVDGGKSWRNMGLDASFQIGRIVIHPTNPDVVYVGALGRLWGPNEERGVYKTADGGETWEKVLYVDEKTGCVDIAMDPSDPNTLLAAMYERQRDEFDSNDPSKRWGPGSGLYKTVDGGETWNNLTTGLPDRPLGRIGVSFSHKNSNVVFAVVESDMNGTGPATAFIGITGGQRVPRAVIQGVMKDGPAEKAGLQKDDVIVAINDVQIRSYNDLVVKIRGHKPDDTVKIKIERGDEEKIVDLTFGKRGGDASSRPFATFQGGQRPNAQKEQGEKGPQTGGVYKSTDGGESWERVNSLNPRPFYYSQIRVDPSNENVVYVLGVQLFRSTNGGEKFDTFGKNVHPDHHALWIDPRDGRRMILGCDGGLYITYDRGQTWDFHNIMDIGQFYDVGVDTRPNYRVYGGLQDNGSWGGPSRKRGRIGQLNSDWEMVGGGDGFVCRVDPNDPNLVYCEMQNGRIWRVNLKTGARGTIYPNKTQASGVRFNWKTPFTLSNHNSTIFYCAGNFVFRSLDRGNNLQKISPEISRTKRGSATALSESPLDVNVIYVGTDDGALWVTRNGGDEWKDIAEKVGLPDRFHVSSIEASRFKSGRAYVSFDGHRSNNDDPHVFVTEDFGETWQSIRSNLPTGSTRVLREDVRNESLLYVGTEFAVWATLDRGGEWTKINNNLPTVAIHEIAVHPTQGEIVVATHGRSLWILDVTPLQQYDTKVAAAEVHIFEPQDGVLWSGTLLSWRFGHQNFVGKNAEFGTKLHYVLRQNAKDVGIEIRDIRGNLVRQLKANKKAGLHSVRWDLRQAVTPERGRPRIGSPVKPGVYLAKLIVDGREFVQEIKVEGDPDFPIGLLQEELELQQSKKRPVFIE